MYTLVVCEKPDAARRIAHALGKGGSVRESRQAAGVPILDVETADGQLLKVCFALGHLYGLADQTNSRSVYPVFDIDWVPKIDLGKRSYLSSRGAKILKAVSDLSVNATKFVHACDYDQEGEVIGYNILQYACNNKYQDSFRAKFSTLTDDEIRESFEKLLKPNAGLADAGRSRHMLDFLYGINLSRALSQSFMKSNDGKRYRNLSIGRVQGPTLAFIVDKEHEIRMHVPDPYWTISAEFEKDGQEVVADYEKPRIEKLAEAQAISDACVGRDGRVTEISKQEVPLRPPAPFNLGDLQMEAYRLFKISPSYTVSIAERLYLDALISYPRTSSQKLPQSIGYRKILAGLSQAGNYGALTSVLLSKQRLVPNEGYKTDPAHPAIYPTGVAPKRKMDPLQWKLYDLVVRRFLATFGDRAVVKNTAVLIDVNGCKFKAEGRSTVYEGWMYFYKPYARLEQSELPELASGDVLQNLGITMEEKFTQPPYRFNQASLLERMEAEKIGTKATRADIIATLFKRNYVASKVSKRYGGIEATDLGFAVIESMRSFVPSIVSTDLTRSMEEQLEKIEEGTSDPLNVISYAVDRLVESLAIFVKQEVAVGQQITEAVVISNAAQRAGAKVIGKCPVCKTGNLRIIQSPATKKRFVGCSNYSKDGKGCTATAPLPRRGRISAGGKGCEICGWPVIGVMFRARSKPWKICINMKCPSKEKAQA